MLDSSLQTVCSHILNVIRQGSINDNQKSVRSLIRSLWTQINKFILPQEQNVKDPLLEVSEMLNREGDSFYVLERFLTLGLISVRQQKYQLKQLVSTAQYLVEKMNQSQRTIAIQALTEVFTSNVTPTVIIPLAKLGLAIFPKEHQLHKHIFYRIQQLPSFERFQIFQYIVRGYCHCQECQVLFLPLVRSKCGTLAEVAFQFKLILLTEINKFLPQEPLRGLVDWYNAYFSGEDIYPLLDKQSAVRWVIKKSPCSLLLCFCLRFQGVQFHIATIYSGGKEKLGTVVGELSQGMKLVLSLQQSKGSRIIQILECFHPTDTVDLEFNFSEAGSSLRAKNCKKVIPLGSAVEIIETGTTLEEVAWVIRNPQNGKASRLSGFLKATLSQKNLKKFGLQEQIIECVFIKTNKTRRFTVQQIYTEAGGYALAYQVLARLTANNSFVEPATVSTIINLAGLCEQSDQEKIALLKMLAAQPLLHYEMTLYFFSAFTSQIEQLRTWGVLTSGLSTVYVASIGYIFEILARCHEQQALPFFNQIIFNMFANNSDNEEQLNTFSLKSAHYFKKLIESESNKCLQEFEFIISLLQGFIQICRSDNQLKKCNNIASFLPILVSGVLSEKFVGEKYKDTFQIHTKNRFCRFLEITYSGYFAANSNQKVEDLRRHLSRTISVLFHDPEKVILFTIQNQKQVYSQVLIDAVWIDTFLEPIVQNKQKSQTQIVLSSINFWFGLSQRLRHEPSSLVLLKVFQWYLTCESIRQPFYMTLMNGITKLPVSKRLEILLKAKECLSLTRADQSLFHFKAASIMIELFDFKFSPEVLSVIDKSPLQSPLIILMLSREDQTLQDRNSKFLSALGHPAAIQALQWLKRSNIINVAGRNLLLAGAMSSPDIISGLNNFILGEIKTLLTPKNVVLQKLPISKITDNSKEPPNANHFIKQCYKNNRKNRKQLQNTISNLQEGFLCNETNIKIKSSTSEYIIDSFCTADKGRPFLILLKEPSLVMLPRRKEKIVSKIPDRQTHFHLDGIKAEYYYITLNKIYQGQLVLNHLEQTLEFIETGFPSSQAYQALAAMPFESRSRQDVVCSEQLHLSISLKHTVVQIKKYLQEYNALELFADRKVYFFVFLNPNDPILNKMHSKCQWINPKQKLKKTIEKWQWGLISNFSYLMRLNDLSGRTVSSVSQYYIMPWTCVDFQSRISAGQIKMQGQHLRDLSLPIGKINPERFKALTERYKMASKMEDSIEPPALYSSYISNPSIVCSYLIRLRPFVEIHHALLNNKFDVPDRLFTSLQQSFKRTYNNQSDFRQLVPELYYLSQVARNRNRYDFGSLEESKKLVDDLELPPWTLSLQPQETILRMRECLNSPGVTVSLHRWIDQTFGCLTLYENAARSDNLYNVNSYPKSQNNSFSKLFYKQFGQIIEPLLMDPHPSCEVSEANSFSGKMEQFSQISQLAQGIKTITILFLQIGNVFVSNIGIHFEKPSAEPYQLSVESITIWKEYPSRCCLLAISEGRLVQINLRKKMTGKADIDHRFVEGSLVTATSVKVIGRLLVVSNQNCALLYDQVQSSKNIKVGHQSLGFCSSLLVEGTIILTQVSTYYNSIFLLTTQTTLTMWTIGQQVSCRFSADLTLYLGGGQRVDKILPTEIGIVLVITNKMGIIALNFFGEAVSNGKLSPGNQVATAVDLWDQQTGELVIGTTTGNLWRTSLFALDAASPQDRIQTSFGVPVKLVRVQQIGKHRRLYLSIEKALMSSCTRGFAAVQKRIEKMQERAKGD